MDEFVARKIGEVLAFAEVGLETFEKGREGLVQVFGEEVFGEINNKNSEHAGKLKEIVENAGVSEMTLAKARSTRNKLKFMRDYYISDEWHDPIELCEWLGFFEGATIVHWKLVQGAAETLQEEKLLEISKQAISFHQGLINKISEAIKKIGSEKSQ